MATGEGSGVETVQIFLCKLDMKPHNYMISSSDLKIKNVINIRSKFFIEKFSLERFDQFSTLKNDFENQNFEMFIHNFGI